MTDAPPVIPDLWEHGDDVEDDGNDVYSYGYPNVPIDGFEPPVNDNVEGEATFHGPQLAFILSESKYTIGQAGIRGGKTHGGAFKSIVYSISHPCEGDEYHLVCSPTFPMSKVPVEKIFALLYDKRVFPINPLIRFVRSERVFILQSYGGKTTKLKVCSLHDPDRLRGIKALSAWVDEGAYVEKYAWEVIQGRLMDANGPAWITTTPAGYNWVFELYEEALAEKRAGVEVAKRKVRFVHWGSAENPFLSKEGLADLAARYDSKTADQELRALFVKQSGLVYRFNRARNVKNYRLDRTKPIFIGQDFNVSAMASAWCQQSGNGLHFFHDRLAHDSDTPQLVLYVNEWCAKHNFPKSNVYFFPDASGSARSTSGKSDIKLLRDAGYKVVFARRNPFIKDRVNCVNGLLAPFVGGVRMFVDPWCTNIIESMEKQVWDVSKDPPEPDKSKGFDHIMDATGYVTWGRFPLAVTASTGSRKAA